MDRYDGRSGDRGRACRVCGADRSIVPTTAIASRRLRPRTTRIPTTPKTAICRRTARTASSSGAAAGSVTIAAVLGLAVVGTAGAFGYRAFTSSGQCAVEPAGDQGRPDAAENRSGSRHHGEHRQQAVPGPRRRAGFRRKVVPREEQPVSLPMPPAPAAPRITAPQPSAQAVAPLVLSPPPPTSVNEPKKVKTVIIRQDAPRRTDAASAGSAADRPDAHTDKAVRPRPDDDRAAIRSRVAHQGRDAHAPPAPAASGAYVVQVSAQRTEAEAQLLLSGAAVEISERARQPRRQHPARRSRRQGRLFFRAQVGPFATSEQANTFCNSLKDAGGQCIVQKN